MGEQSPPGGSTPSWWDRPQDGPLVGHDGPDFPDTDPAGQAGSVPAHRPPRRRVVPALLALTAVLLTSLAAGYAGAWLHDRTTGSAPRLELAEPADVDRPADSVAGVAARVLPSVVSIEVTFPGGQGSGSGFVIGADGYVLTNNHVVANGVDSGDIVVVFSDGSQAEAEVVGRTTGYDLAVLRVDRTGLPALELADSDAVVVGDPVVAVGAPLGLESTVTTGIVSALNRPVSAGNGDESAFINAIQTDAAINPGNSGGPLVDLQGRVIGVNSAIARAPGSGLQGAGNIGLGFAIPSTQAARTAQEIIDTGRATYPVIGVLLDSSYRGEGVKVVEETPDDRPVITPGGPADRAGIRPGDLIVAFEGRPVTDPDELIVAIRAQRPGDSVTLTVRRDGQDRDVTLELEEAESD
ncbi:S1C family serine protease [Quadrisphaera sp. GCM10027208]|uniref:S1C family serine protease n=1 Tax=Quadrisphaera sp. GCM10027208 TaxID=3273423 RepID=UPI003606C0FF